MMVHKVSKTFKVEKYYWELKVTDLQRLLDEVPEEHRAKAGVILKHQTSGSGFGKLHSIVAEVQWFIPEVR